jgi:hypothetical protein
MYESMTCFIVLAALTAGRTCSPVAPGDRLRDGTWGGDHIRFDVTAAATSVDLDCAHGMIEGPIELDKDGRFEVAGKYVAEHPGPTRDDEETGRPARYVGKVTGGTMTLTITAEGAAPMGPYSLAHDSMGNVRKCR